MKKKMAVFYKLLFVMALLATTVSSLPLQYNEEQTVRQMLLDENDRHPRDIGDSIEERVQLIFDQLPNGTDIQSIIEYLPGALGVYYSLPRMFIDTVLPGPLPYEILTEQLSGLFDGFLPANEDGSGSNDNGGGINIQGELSDVAVDFVKWMVPTLVVFALGLLLAVCFPFVGCCFCCCRLCGNCGGKSYKYRTKNQSIKCIIPTVILLLSILPLLVGIVFGFLSNDKITNAIMSYPDTAKNALDDGVNYLTGTADEVVFIADNELDRVFDAVNHDVENIGSVLGGSIETALETEAASFLNSSRSLLDELDQVNTGLENINNTLNELMSLSNQLNSSVSELKEALGNLSTMCGGNPACTNIIPAMEDVAVALDWNDVADVTSALSVLEGVDINGTRNLIDDSSQLFGNITSQIDEHFTDFELPLNISQFDAVDELIETVQDFVNSTTAEGGTIDTVRDALDTGDMFISMFDKYRYGLVVALFLLVTLILVVFILGIVCGIFGYSRKALPFERTSVSHCGAIMLLIGVALCFLACGSLVIISSFTYFLSSGVQKLCNDLAPSEYTLFQRVIDNPEVWDGNSLIGRVLEQQLNISSNLTVTSILRQCEENAPIYQALEVEKIFDIEELLSNLTNLTDSVDIGDLDVGSFLTVSSSDIIPNDTRQSLESLQQDVSNAINFTEYQQFLNESVITFDLQELSDNLTTLADAFAGIGNTAAEDYTRDLIANLVGVEINSTVMDISQQTGYGSGNITEVEATIEGINVTQVFNQLDEVLNRTIDIVTTEVDAYIDQVFGYFTDYIDFALNAIQNEVGRCRPLSAAYQGIHTTFCKDTLDGVNGFWFSVGWCVLFLIPMVICGAIVTNYLRRSPTNIETFTGGNEKMSPRRTDHVIANTGATVTGYRQPAQTPRTTSPHIPQHSGW